MKTTFLLSVACFNLSGCVGVVAYGTKTTVTANPVLKASGGLNSVQPTPDRKSPPTYSRAWVTKHWGEPSELRPSRNGGEEEWVYGYGTYFLGVMPCVIVPIPLTLNVGEESVALTFRNGRVVSASQRAGKSSGAVMGLFPNPYGGLVFRGGHSAQVR